MRRIIGLFLLIYLFVAQIALTFRPIVSYCKSNEGYASEIENWQQMKTTLKRMFLNRQKIVSFFNKNSLFAKLNGRQDNRELRKSSHSAEERQTRRRLNCNMRDTKLIDRSFIDSYLFSPASSTGLLETLSESVRIPE